MRYTTIRRWYPYIKKWVNTRTIIINKCLNLEQKYPKFWILFRSIAQLFNGWPLHHTDLITELSCFWDYTIVPKLNSIIRFLYTLTGGKRSFIALSKVHGDWETKLITSNAINCYTRTRDGNFKYYDCTVFPFGYVKLTQSVFYNDEDSNIWLYGQIINCLGDETPSPIKEKRKTVFSGFVLTKRHLFKFIRKYNKDKKES